MKSFGSSVFLFVFALCAFSQNGANSNIVGRVTDAGGSAVAGATISVVSSSYPVKTYTAISDEEGAFEFYVPPGKAVVRATKSENGIEMTSEVVETRFSTDNATIVNLVVNSVVGIREYVDVRIATGTSQPFSSVSKTIDVVEGSEIRNRNDMTFVDSINTVPGFRIQQLGGFGRTASIKTRGLRNQDTAILLDGQRLRDPASITGDASAFISDINLVNVGRIEVLRGSGSSVYGTNAIGSVVDIQSRRAEDGFSGSFLGEYGGLGFSRFNGNAAYGKRDGKVGFTAGFSRTGVTRGIDGEDDGDNSSFQGRFDAAPVSRLSLSARLFVSDSYVRLNSNPDTFGALPFTGVIDAESGVNFVADANDPDNFQRSDFFSGQLHAAYIVNASTVFSASYQGLDTRRENENGELGPGFQPFGGTQTSIFDGQIHTFSTKFDWTPFRGVRLITGYEYELEKYGNEGLGPTVPDDFSTNVNQSSGTFFAQYLQGFLQNRLQLAGGFRAQAFSLSAPVFSINNAPYSGLALSDPPAAYTFDGAASYFHNGTGTKVRAHIGNGYRVPSLYERFGSFYSSFSQSFTAVGDPNLQPEKSIAFDAGVDQNLWRGRVTLSNTYFYTRLTDTIGYGNQVPDIGSTQRPFGGYENTKGGIARGVEFSALATPDTATRAFASYTFTNSDQRSPQVSGSGIARTLGIPDHRFTFDATRVFGKSLTLNFNFAASSSYLAPIFSTTSFSTRIYRFKGDKRGDVSARYTLPVFNEKAKASFFATVENLFGYAYFENGFAIAGRTARTGVSFEF